MKILIFMMLTLISCKAQNPNKTNMPKKLEVFDIDDFNERKKIIGYEGYYKEKDIYIRQFGDSLSGYVEYETHPLPKIFQIFRRFHPNGNLMIKGLNFPNDFEKGIWREYDEQGNLIKETDYVKDFGYTWENLLELLKERKVNIKDTVNTTIRKDEGRWHVWYVEGLYVFNIFIDGKTGEILLDDKDEFEEGS